MNEFVSLLVLQAFARIYTLLLPAIFHIYDDHEVSELFRLIIGILLSG